MRTPTLYRLGALAALVGAAACADAPAAPDAPAVSGAFTGPSLAAASAVTASSPFSTGAFADDNVAVSPELAALDDALAAAGANIRVSQAELLLDGNSYDAASSTVIIANNRTRGISSEWVAGDPRRGGRVGVTWAFGSSRPSLPFTRNPDGSNLHQVPLADLDTQLQEGLAAWRSETCSTAPITRVAIAPGTDPDQLDEYFRGLPASANYVQPADIVESGWQPAGFFTAVGGPSGNSIIGVTFTFHYIDALGNPTDIDHNGKFDTALAEIFYNTRFAWGNSQAANVVDFYSIITHETGHAMGLAHFGKVFVTKNDATDGIQIADIKYAPKAMMNAVYVTGRSEIAGTDNSSFCQIWASKK
jgi:hypothetical protein